MSEQETDFVKIARDEKINVMYGFFIDKQTKEPIEIEGKLIQKVKIIKLCESKISLVTGDRARTIIKSLSEKQREPIIALVDKLSEKEREPLIPCIAGLSRKECDLVMSKLSDKERERLEKLRASIEQGKYRSSPSKKKEPSSFNLLLDDKYISTIKDYAIRFHESARPHFDFVLGNVKGTELVDFLVAGITKDQVSKKQVNYPTQQAKPVIFGPAHDMKYLLKNKGTEPKGTYGAGTWVIVKRGKARVEKKTEPSLHINIYLDGEKFTVFPAKRKTGTGEILLIRKTKDNKAIKKKNRADPKLEAEAIGEEEFPAIVEETKGKIGIVQGVNAKGFTGGFINAEIDFIKEIMFLKNEQLEGGRSLQFEEANVKLLNGNDVHLFCGHSEFGNTRVDIRKKYPYEMQWYEIETSPGVVQNRPKEKPTKDPVEKQRRKEERERLQAEERVAMCPTSATDNVLVNDFIANAINKRMKYDLIIIDPPYNEKYDREYGTYKYNKIGDDNAFFADLVENCMKIINDDGVIISKNWRNMRPVDSRYVSGIISQFGSFRRVVIMEAWQYKPTQLLDFSWDLFDEITGKETLVIDWYLGITGKWIKTELKIIKKYVDISQTKNGILITDPPGEGEAKPIKLGNLKNLTVDEFLADDTKRDVIILDEAKGVGGNTPKTGKLKEHLGESISNKAMVAWQNRILNHAEAVLKNKGFIITKSYFNPVLEEFGLTLLDKRAILFENFEKISLLHIYQKI